MLKSEQWHPGSPETPMTELLEDAMAKARALAPETQDEIARMVLSFAGGGSVVTLTAGEEVDLAKSEADADRGAFATEDEVRAIWAKHGL